MSDRYITLWRKVDDIFEWDFHISDSVGEAETVVKNLKDHGVKQFTTFVTSGHIDDLSSSFKDQPHDQ